MTVEIITYDNQLNIRAEWAEFRRSFYEDAPPRDTARTWGFEIETPEADNLRENMTRDQLALVEFHQDPSIEGGENNEDCECDCRSCYYHECDCDSCEVEGSSDPDHDCGSSSCYSEGTEYQEITTLAGGVKTTHPEALAVLIEAGLTSAKITSSCGLHMNIGSKDLTPYQVSRVVSAYRMAYPLLTVIAGRESERFAKAIKPEVEESARRGQATEKMTAVNTSHHFSNLMFGRPDEARIEFRQHKGENDPAEIRAWAWLMIELVEFAKSERPFYWLAQAKSLAEFRKALR
jgi:hypothetical protein